jgi:putative transposase
MPRFRRVVVPGFPHHVTDRGNRRSIVFLDDSDRLVFLHSLHENAEYHLLHIFAYSLMPNHFHLVCTPEEDYSIARTMHNVLGSYGNYFNAKYHCCGRLWQGRFHSCVMDDSHFLAALLYVEGNPVRAGLVKRAEDYQWSSAAAHCCAREDSLLAPLPFAADFLARWSEWLKKDERPAEIKLIRTSSRCGRPCGFDAFIDKLEQITGRKLKPRKGGRPQKPKIDS